MKYKALTITSIIAFAIVAGLIVWQQSEHDEGDIVVGLVLPLTGDAATFGTNVLNGANLAAEDLRTRPGAPTLKLIAEDSRGQAPDAAAALRKLLDINHINAAIGDVTSAATHALIPIADESHTPLISPSASDPALTGVSPMFARLWPSDVFEASIISKYIETKGYKSTAVVYASTDYGEAMVAQLRALFGRDRPCLEAAVSREAGDYRPTIQRTKLSGCDSVFIVLYPEGGSTFIRQFREAGMSLPIMATATIEDPQVARVAGDLKIVFASPVPPDDTQPARARFVRQYTQRFGEPPGVLSDIGYDAINILVDSWRRTKTKDGAGLAKAIRSTENFAGVSGTISIDSKGDVHRPYRLKTVKDGAFVWLGDVQP